MAPGESYQRAYQLHYKKKDYTAAFLAYIEVIHTFPTSNEAKYSWQQLGNITEYISINALKIPSELEGTFREVVRKYDLDEEVKAQKVADDLAIKKQAEMQQQQQQAWKELFLNDSGIVGYLGFHSESKQWALMKNTGTILSPECRITKVFQFSDLIDYEVIENGNSIQKGSAGTAALGYLAFGVAGAIVGSAVSRENIEMITDLHIAITVKDVINPSRTIPIITKPTNRNSIEFQKASQICEKISAILRYIMDSNKRTQEKSVQARAIYAFSVADEILKFKSLLDDGIITHDEFEAQKKKLLSLDY